jgi:type IV secretory pathway protease TraF
VWNGSPSAPRGLWLRHGAGEGLRVGDWVVVRPPPGLAAWLSARGYLPSGLLLVKRVAALEGQAVCRCGSAVRVDGRRVATARARDGLGRLLPAWRGCRRLGRDEVLLLNPAADSLDGRYFGVVSRSRVVGRARLAWRAR